MSDRDSVPLYFGMEKREIFGWYHPGFNSSSVSQRHVGVVLCNPIGDDYIRAHRIIRHIAESLSFAGFPVLRFDFHGTGDSSGSEEDPERVYFWLNDIELAIEKLRKLSGVGTFALAGLKLGATLAMAAAERRDDIESLILWSPYLSGKDYVMDVTRLHKTHKMLGPDAFAIDPPSRDIEGEECLGFILSRSTINDLEKIDLLTVKKLTAKRVLIMGSGGTGTWQETLSNYLTKIGAKADILSSVESDKFLVMVNHQASVPEGVVGSITEWMKTHAGKGDVIGDVQKSLDRLSAHEQPILFGENRSLFGILHTNRTTKSDIPALVLLNSGTVHRIGPHRLYLKMARKWAELGFPVFRIDLSGIGDSVAGAGSDENLCYPPSAQKDIQAAFKVLETRLEVKRFVLIGLCSGADITFKMGLKDPRVVGTIMMNPLTFCIYEPKLVEEWDRAHQLKESIFNKHNWSRILKGDIKLTNAVRALFAYIVSLARNKPPLNNDKESNALKIKETNVPECLRCMVEKGIDTLVVVADKDPGVHYVDTHFGEAMTALKDVAGYRRIDFQGTDHTFTSCFAQGEVIKAITEHISRKYL